MSFAALLGLGAALSWGAADFLGGVQSRHLQALTVVFWGQVVGATGLLMVVPSIAERAQLDGMAWGFAAGVVGILAVTAFYRGLAVGLMSIVAPVSACGAIVPVIVALVRGEPPSPLSTAGILSALTGIVFVSRSTREGGVVAVNPRLALALALVAAVGFGAFFVLIDQGATAGGSPLWTIVGMKIGGISTTLAIAALRPAFTSWPGRRMWLVGAIGVLDTTASALFAFGTSRGNLGVLAVLAAQYPVVTVLLARWTLSERLSRFQLVGVGLALVGVTLLAAG